MASLLVHIEGNGKLLGKFDRQRVEKIEVKELPVAGAEERERGLEQEGGRLLSSRGLKP